MTFPVPSECEANHPHIVVQRALWKTLPRNTHIDVHQQVLFLSNLTLLKDVVSFIHISPDPPAVVLEAMDTTLQDLFSQSHSFSLHEVEIIISPLLNVLSQLHKSGYCLCSLNADSVLINFDGSVMTTVKLSDPELYLEFINDSDFVDSVFLAPEGKSTNSIPILTKSSDVYSFGVLLLGLLLRKDPCVLVSNVKNSYLTFSFDFLKELGIHDCIIELIHSMLQQDPNLRPEIHEVKEILEEVLSSGIDFFEKDEVDDVRSSVVVSEPNLADEVDIKSILDPQGTNFDDKLSSFPPLSSSSCTSLPLLGELSDEVTVNVDNETIVEAFEVGLLPSLKSLEKSSSKVVYEPKDDVNCCVLFFCVVFLVLGSLSVFYFLYVPYVRDVKQLRDDVDRCLKVTISVYDIQDVVLTVTELSLYLSHCLSPRFHLMNAAYLYSYDSYELELRITPSNVTRFLIVNPFFDYSTIGAVDHAISLLEPLNGQTLVVDSITNCSLLRGAVESFIDKSNLVPSFLEVSTSVFCSPELQLSVSVSRDWSHRTLQLTCSFVLSSAGEVLQNAIASLEELSLSSIVITQDTELSRLDAIRFVTSEVLLIPFEITPMSNSLYIIRIYSQHLSHDFLFSPVFEVDEAWEMVYSIALYLSEAGPLVFSGDDLTATGDPALEGQIVAYVESLYQDITGLEFKVSHLQNSSWLVTISYFGSHNFVELSVEITVALEYSQLYLAFLQLTSLNLSFVPCVFVDQSKCLESLEYYFNSILLLDNITFTCTNLELVGSYFVNILLRDVSNGNIREEIFEVGFIRPTDSLLLHEILRVVLVSIPSSLETWYPSVIEQNEAIYDFVASFITENLPLDNITVVVDEHSSCSFDYRLSLSLNDFSVTSCLGDVDFIWSTQGRVYRARKLLLELKDTEIFYSFPFGTRDEIFDSIYNLVIPTIGYTGVDLYIVQYEPSVHVYGLYVSFQYDYEENSVSDFVEITVEFL
ncbi:hypothetical protein RCL1_004924 [Eukaryota sp. TZLM3-RCL]